MTEEFKVGTVVCLKSGGPPMTVTHVIEAIGAVTVAWFNENLEMRYESLNKDCFEPAVLIEDKPENRVFAS
jgi:uncharacterized protein YodC (DUF2158 family)